MDETFVISAGVLSMITLELVKLAIRKWWVKNPEYDFPPLFYNLVLPFLTAVWSIGLGYVGLGEPVAFTWQSLLQWLVSIIVALAAYTLGLSPMKDYVKEYKFRHL